VVKFRMIFYTSGGLESGGLGRVVCDGDTDSMLQFRLERESDGMENCWKMKQS
jgi:hypothetical protein